MFDTAGATTERVSDVIDAWIAGARRQDIADLPGEVATISRIVDQAQGMLRLRIAQLDRSGQATDRGMPISTSRWLQTNTGASPPMAARQVTSARILDEVLPQTGELLRTGEMSTDQVDSLCRTVDHSQTTRQTAAADETGLLDIIRPVPTRHLPTVLAHWRHTVDPDGSQDDEQRQYDRRRLWISKTFQNTYDIYGTLDPVGGATVKAALDALCAPAGEDDRRPPHTRRADALVQLARQALDSRHLPEVAGERPHITVTMDIRTLTGQSSEPADLEHVGAISSRLARQIACDAGIVRIITDGPSEILDVGRRTRTVPPALRRALSVRDRGCVFDDCHHPTSWCDAHHVQHWADGGPTTLDNLALLCPQHHRAIHQLGWTLKTNPNGGWNTHPPHHQPHANPWTSNLRRKRRARRTT
jgi:Domain of unknown function (DUF222)/HNH endonuclease